LPAGEKGGAPASGRAGIKKNTDRLPGKSPE